MAVVIRFQDIVRARRRQQERAYTERCIEIIEFTLHLALHMLDTAAPQDRALYARRVRKLGELLEYAVQTL
jgi:hypothetical protein